MPAAAACEAIKANPDSAYDYTARGNLVAVISNGTAVLGLGDIGPEASKPVMEGKGLLFKIFADIDVFDIEVAENDPKRFVDVVAALEPTFGGINLEDIKAPECFAFEKKLHERMNIPVFHEPQEYIFNDKKFLIGHGDGLGPGDKGYKFLKKIFRSLKTSFVNY